MADIEAAMSELLITLVHDQRVRLLQAEGKLEAATQQVDLWRCSCKEAEQERNALRAQRGELLTQLRLVRLERDELESQQAPATAEPSGDSGQFAEPTKDPGELPEPYQWRVGDEIECQGVTRRLVERVHGGWVTLEGVESPLAQPDWERRGWTLHRKAEIKTAEAEPHQWQVGDEILCGNRTHKVFDVLADDQVWLMPTPSLPGYHTQQSLEGLGYKLHRRAEDIKAAISDSVGTDGEAKP